MRTTLTVCVLALTSLQAIADSPLDDLSNEKVLEGAVAEIKSMKLNDLDVAIQYIAACQETASSERDYHCGENFTIISIKIDKAPQFIKLSKAVYLAAIKGQEAKEKGPMASIGASMLEIRRSEIFGALQNAARERYQRLSK